jgi:hypothetical protein
MTTLAVVSANAADQTTETVRHRYGNEMALLSKTSFRVRRSANCNNVLHSVSVLLVLILRCTEYSFLPQTVGHVSAVYMSARSLRLRALARHAARKTVTEVSAAHCLTYFSHNAAVHDARYQLPTQRRRRSSRRTVALLRLLQLPNRHGLEHKLPP